MTSPDLHGPEPTDAQWSAIAVTDDHLLVSAGAGTGKTFTVVSHILYLMGVQVRGAVHASPLQLADIAAITYTNKAAAELQEKLRARLRAAGRIDDAYRVDSARVGTIHSFCGDILREYALRSSLAPSLRLLEDAEANALYRDCVREALLGALESAPGSEGHVDGVEALLELHSASDAERWMSALLRQGDHLRAIAARADALPARERTVALLAQRAAALIDARLREHAEMDFDHMITWTRDLIRDDASVRRSLQRRIRVLIIDEFQDVDPVQREIAYLLGDPASRSRDTTRLMLVGDPKQSIYSFRRADVRGWKQVERDFAENGWGVVVRIADSRRSVRPVLGFVDHAIGALLDEPIGESTSLRDFEVAYSHVNPVREDGPSDHVVEFLCTPANEKGAAHDAKTVRQTEAANVARRARELHDGAEQVGWKDMALLLQSWSDLECYQSALERAGIPTYALRSEGFYERREILDLIVALEAIRNPCDDRVLLGFLRSPFAGVTDETLLRLTYQQQSPVWPRFTKTLEKIADGSQRAMLERAHELLEQLIRLRDRVPSSALLAELLSRSAYLAHCALLDKAGDQAIANVRKLLALADAAPEATLGDFLEGIEEARVQHEKECNVRLYGESDDVLTITTIHSAKGLEWKVVFWSDLVRQRLNSAPSLLVSGTQLSLAQNADEADEDCADDEPEAAAAHQSCKTAHFEERDAELKRLWYVAATRARDRLIIGVPLGSSQAARDRAAKRAAAGEAPDRAFLAPADAIKRIFPELGTAKTERYRSKDGRDFNALVHVLEVDAHELEPDTEEARAARLAAQPALGVSVLAPLLAPIALPEGRLRHSATELLALDRCGKRRWFKYVAGIREPRLGEFERQGELSAIARGLIIHDVLERHREDLDLDVLIDDAVRRHDPDASSLDDVSAVPYRDEVRNEIRDALERPEYATLSNAPGARRELPFLYLVASDVYVEGKIDLVVAGDDGYRVIDIKTGSGDADAAVKKAEHYAVQKAVYVRAIEEISGGSVVDFAFDFTGAGARVGGALDEAEREDIRSLLDRSLLELAVLPPTLARNAEECRYCGYRKDGWCPGVLPSPSSAQPLA